ncbi:MAG: GMC family oxidoreductase, partial [Gemmatimonadetes bacterium 13_1_40CM_3_69_22]
MITYDAIVVGSGITGGWAAKELTEKGLRTLMIERGRDVVHRKDYITEHKPSWELPLRDARLSVGTKGAEEYPIQARTGQFRESNKHFFLKDAKNPYVEDKPFTWIQGDQVGGKSLIWGRQVYRWSDLDFEANLRDGHGVDWPIRYADIAPWYSYVERFIGVSGEKLGLAQLPDGEFQPPMEMNAGENLVKGGIERAFPDRHVTIGRVAILTQPLNGRLPCHYCGPCERGCSTGSYFSSQSSTLPAARATGRVTILPNSVAHSLIYDAAKNRVTGVRVVDVVTKQAREYEARVVFLCASTLATTRLLLSSTSPRFPNGLANSSGVLGHYLMDHHFLAGASGSIEGLLDHYYQGNRPNGIYIPRFRNLGDDASRRVDYVRGFGYQGGASRQSWGRGGGERGFGVELKRKLHDPGRWSMGMTGFGECLPREDNYVELSDKTDDFGIPLLKIHCTWGDNELAMRKDMAASAAE